MKKGATKSKMKSGHNDAAMDKKLIKSMVKKKAMKGSKSKGC